MFLDTWRYVWASHAASTLVIVPVALTLGRQGRRTGVWSSWGSRPRALFAVTLLVFAPDQPLAIAFAPLPLLVWASLRLGVRALTWELLATSVLGTVMTAEGHGPFAANVATGASTVAGAGAMVQLWLLSAALMSLPLTVTVEQRRHLLDAVTARERAVPPQLHRVADRDAAAEATARAARDRGRERRGPPPDRRGDRSVVGRYLDRVVDQPTVVRAAAQQMLDGDRDGWTAQLGLVDRPRTRVDVSVSLISGGDEPVLAAQLLDVTAEHNARARIEAAEKLTSATLDTAACIMMVADMAGHGRPGQRRHLRPHRLQ